MPRRLRVATGGYAYHVLNRRVGKRRLFAKERDFEAFEEIIGHAKERLPMRVLAWCVMPTHYLCEAPHNQWLAMAEKPQTSQVKLAASSSSRS